MKGLAVALRYYTKPELRTSVDTDLLVAVTDLRKSAQVLKALGFVQTTPDFEVTDDLQSIVSMKISALVFYRESDEVQIDLHWRLVKKPWILDWDMETVAPTLETFPVGDQSIRVLDAPHQFVFLAAHGANHGWRRLKWVYDIHRMVTMMTVAEIEKARELAVDAGSLPIFNSALMISQAYFSTNVDDMASNDRTAVKINSIAESRMRLPERSGETFSAGFLMEGAGFEFLISSGPGGAFRSLIHQAYSLRDIDTLRLSNKWLPVYVLLGPILMLRRRFFERR